MPGEPRLPRLRPEELTDDQRRVYDSIAGGPRAGTPGLVDGEGRLGGPLNTYLYSGAGGEHAALGSALTFSISLPKRLAELVILTVANHIGSEFELAAHERFG